MKRIVFIIIGILSNTALRADTIVVPDPDAGIETIQQALQRSFPGDEIVIAPGHYDESLAITTPSLTLRGMGDVTIQGLSQVCLWSCDVYTPILPAIKADSLDGLTLINLRLVGGSRIITYYIFQTSSNDVEPPPRVGGTVSYTTASLVLHQSNVSANQSSFYSYKVSIEAIDSQFRLSDSATSNQLSLINTMAQFTRVASSGEKGEDGDDYSSFYPPTWPTMGKSGFPTMILENSCLFHSHSSIRGGTGGDGGDGYGWDAPSWPGARGGDAMIVKGSSRIHADASVIKGGTGGRSGAYSYYWHHKGGTGGDAMNLEANVMVIDAGSLITGGDGGAPSPYWGWLPGDDGNAMNPADHPGYLVIPPMARAIDHILGRLQLPPDDIDALDLNGDGQLDVADLIIRQHPCQAWP